MENIHALRKENEMKVAKMVAAVGLTLALGAGLAACGGGYTGEGVVKGKEVTSQSKSKSSSKTTNKKYKVTIDVPNTDVDQVLTIPKNQYDAVQVGQNVKIEDGNIKQ